MAWKNPAPFFCIADSLERGFSTASTYLSKREETLLTADSRPIFVWDLSVPEDSPNISLWARTFRQHYCLDTEIDELREGTGLSRAEYLTELVFPDKSKAPGPSIRSGDFAELLIAMEWLRSTTMHRSELCIVEEPVPSVSASRRPFAM